MKIISHHPAHLSEILANGSAVINGKVFVLDGGKPTCTNASEYDCGLFASVPGFEFLHDDGTKAGESRLREKAIGLSTITEALNNGKVTVDMLRQMDVTVEGHGPLNALLDRALNNEPPAAVSLMVDGQPMSDEAIRQSVAQAAGVPVEAVKVDGENIIIEQPTENIQPAADDDEQGEGEEGDDDEQGEGENQQGEGDGYGDKAAIKQQLTDLGVSFGPRDSRAKLIEKLKTAQAAQQ